MLKRSLNILLIVLVGVVAGLVPATTANALEPTVYNQPGVHNVNGRWWNTECSMYNTNDKIVRCTTSIWGSKPVQHDGAWHAHEGWVPNNVTYLPSPESLWTGNPIATNGSWTDDAGRQWRTECHTANTGADACRTYVKTSFVAQVDGQFTTVQRELLNSIVQFSTSSVPHQTTILDAAPAQPNAPVEEPFKAPIAATVYTQPGDHLVNGRYWKTDCSMYSSEIVRCSTDIWGTKVVSAGGNYYTHNGWSFNSMTYLPAPRALWSSNPLANTGTWTADDGRNWRTECDTAATGRGACRSYAEARVMSYNGGQFTAETKFVLNNIVQFTTNTIPHQKTILPAAPALAGVPVEHEFQVPSTISFQPDARCMTGRALCISKNQRKMAWMINGTVLDVVDVRFGREGTRTQTRNGTHQINWKSRNHVSSIYHTAMPFALFFDGGQAVHYSSNFAAVGYNGNSGGCVNVRDHATMKKLFDATRVGDKVIVYN